MSQWYVVTGGPRSGKTSTLGYVARKGFLVLPETARVLIDYEMSRGKTLEEIRSDEAGFQRKVLKMKIEVEKNVPRDRIVFFDRAIPDSIPYLQVCGVDVRDEVKRILGNEKRYQKVFLLAQVPFKKDYAVTEDEPKAKLLSKLLKETYEELGYDVVDVPVMSVMERDEFILKSLQ